MAEVDFVLGSSAARGPVLQLKRCLILEVVECGCTAEEQTCEVRPLMTSWKGKAE